MMRNAGAREIDSAWNCHWQQENVTLRLSVLGEPGTSVILAEGPRDDQYTPPNIPMVLVRRTTKRTHFVSLLAPSRDSEVTHTMEKLSSARGVLSVRVTGPGFEDHMALGLAFRPRARRLTIVHEGKEHVDNRIYLYKRFEHR